jgi:uncharacterized protein (DUF2132 family)
MVEALLAHYGWEDLGLMINIRCFQTNPSIRSSLTFLRKTPWARSKVEQLYFWMLSGEYKEQKPLALGNKKHRVSQSKQSCKKRQSGFRGATIA